MDRDAVCQLIKARYETLSKQERIAANYILENQNEVAVMSMRDLARLADVAPATMTRLAKRLDLGGYDVLKAAFVHAMRSHGNPYGGRAQKMMQLNKRIGERAHVQNLANDAIAHINALCLPENVDAITRAARRLARARKIHCLGLRSSFTAAYQFSHVASYFADNVNLIDGAGESGVMSIMHQTSPKDVAIVCSLSRYAKKTINIASYLHQRGVSIIAITDSPVSPVGRMASETILVRNNTSSFFDTIVPAMLVTEILVALLSAGTKSDIEQRVSAAEENLMGLGEWWELG
jgi:DNA-binding MurR/RpiR family transcriptional regulator